LVADEIAAIVALAFIVAYAIFGGADFGSGIWSALAGGPRAGQQRNALYKAIGPVWETNNVWLVGAVVVLLAIFPGAMADLFIALLVPLSVGLIGVVFRGGAFAFRNFARESGGETAPLHGIVFSMASVIAPFAFGVALGTTAGGRITLNEGGAVTSGLWRPWLHALPILFGVTAVAVCSYLTASYMTTRSSGALREDFRMRGMLAGVAVGLLAILTLGVSYWDSRDFWDLWQRTAPLAMSGVALLAGLTSLLVIWRRWYSLAPMASGGAMALLVATWGVIQYPYFIVASENIFDVAANQAMVRASLIGLLFGALILVPSALLLYLSFVAESAEEAESQT
jgi:cytochrome d ubiquinol oxidase subunit II